MCVCARVCVSLSFTAQKRMHRMALAAVLFVAGWLLLITRSVEVPGLTSTHMAALQNVSGVRRVGRVTRIINSTEPAV